jgi:hypothetical protein
MMALVRGVMASAIFSGSMLYVAGSMSTRTGFAPHPSDAAHGGEESESGRDHLVAGTDVQAHQRVEDRIRTTRDTHRVFAVAQGSYFLLEFSHHRTADTHLGFQYIRDSRENLVFRLEYWAFKSKRGTCIGPPFTSFCMRPA